MGDVCLLEVMFKIGESKTMENENHKHEMLDVENSGLRCRVFMK